MSDGRSDNKGASTFNVVPLAQPLEKLANIEKEAFTENVTGGKKHTAGKRSNHFVPQQTVCDLSDHMAIGAIKYGHGNWKLGMLLSQIIDAIDSHNARLKAGEWLDAETGTPHVLAIMANGMMANELQRLGRLTHDQAEVYIDAVTGAVKLTPSHAALVRTPYYKKEGAK